MVPGTSTSFFLLVQGPDNKKDLRTRFNDLLEEFKSKSVNGSITLHFSQGYLAKIQSIKFD